MRVIFSYTRQTKTPALRLGSFARTLVRSERYEGKVYRLNSDNKSFFFVYTFGFAFITSFAEEVQILSPQPRENVVPSGTIFFIKNLCRLGTHFPSIPPKRKLRSAGSLGGTLVRSERYEEE